uniref:Homologous recombination OB-fold protein OB-fold domain-containing protein n=1 Tax=Tanacetum cinerariifolium TaxID=118510 RepID=A0A699HLH5_TANCI|nr:hypothetical protein [Tanacetum cinerariifolium]GEY07986.1 hypothetical protein [Tanacetum cinerariifolium]
MYDDMTYSLLVKMVVKIFEFDPNVWLNLSVYIPSLNSQLDIIDDEDVKFFVDCTSNSTDGIPRIHVGQPKKSELRIILGLAGILQSVFLLKNADVMEGSHEIIMPRQDDMKKYYKNRKLERVIGVIMSCLPNVLGDLTVTLKDPSGTMDGTIHYKVFEKEEGYTKSINVIAVLILCNVFVFIPKPSTHYLNITF